MIDASQFDFSDLFSDDANTAVEKNATAVVFDPVEMATEVYMDISVNAIKKFGKDWQWPRDFNPKMYSWQNLFIDAIDRLIRKKIEPELNNIRKGIKDKRSDFVDEETPVLFGDMRSTGQMDDRMYANSSCYYCGNIVNSEDIKNYACSFCRRK